MKIPTHKICTFLFNNGTTISAAVPYLSDDDLEPYELPFNQMMKEAQRISWNGDENQGRGGLKSFTVGERVHIP